MVSLPECSSPKDFVLNLREGARDLGCDVVKTEDYQTSRYQRKKVEMLFAHVLKASWSSMGSDCAARRPR